MKVTSRSAATASDPHGLKQAWPAKQRFVFRVGAPSYVFPAAILPNVRAIAHLVDDVELLLFESDAISPLPDEVTLTHLEDLALTHDLSYTVHLPMDADVGSSDEGIRRESVGKFLRAIRRTESLVPHAFVMHWPRNEGGSCDESGRILWRDALRRSADELKAAGVDLGRVCVETLDYPFEWVSEVIEAFGFSVCLDIGHVILHGDRLEDILARHWGRTTVVHLHGVSEGKDHRPITVMDPQLLERLRSRFCNDDGVERVVTLELFKAERLVESLSVLREWEQ